MNFQFRLFAVLVLFLAHPLDRAQAIVGAPAGTNQHIPIGMSPKNFKANTVGDELKNAGYPSKVVTVALKDRAAILLGGFRAAFTCPKANFRSG